MGFVAIFSEDYLLREKSYWLLLINLGFRKIWTLMGHVIRTILIENHLIKDFTNTILQNINLNLDMTFCIKMIKN